MSRNVRLPAPEPKRKVDASLAIVNIVLLLLFFFLATGSLQESEEVRIALPNTSDLPLAQLPKPLLIVGADSSMILNGETLEPGGLSEALIDDPILHVLADRDTSALTVLETIAAENLIAVEIRLVTIHLSGGADG